MSEDGPKTLFNLRTVESPTNDFVAFVHFIKGCLGTGILAMPYAFRHAGVWFGLVSILIIAFACTLGMHLLVSSTHILCWRLGIPSMSYAEVAEIAFNEGPAFFAKGAKGFGIAINIFLVVDMLGTCCVYVVFVAVNIQQLLVAKVGPIDVRVFMAILWLPLVATNMIRSLRWLSPFSVIANIVMLASIGLCLWYICRSLKPLSSVDSISTINRIPIFFGIAIFALEGIGVVLPLENSMRHPEHLIGCPSVMVIGMCFVVTLYAIFGFLGYLSFGSAAFSSVTLNLPDDATAIAVKAMVSIAIFLTYSLQLHVPVEIVWGWIENTKPARKWPKASHYILRAALVTTTVCVGIIIPNLGPLISLIGAVALSTLGLMTPALINIAVNHKEPGGQGLLAWRLLRNIGLIIFGIIGFTAGLIVSIQEIIETF